MTGPWKHAVSGLSRDEPGHDGLQNSSSGANGIKMQTAHGAVGKRPVVGGTTVGIQAESGWAHQVTPHLLLCLVFGITTTDLELGSPGCPLLVISGNDRNAAAPNLQPKRAKREPAPGEDQERLHLWPGLPVAGLAASPSVRVGSSISAWLQREGPKTTRASGAHFRGIEKNLFPDLQRICSACARSNISESSNSPTISLNQESTVTLRGIRDPEGTANKASLLKSFRG